MRGSDEVENKTFAIRRQASAEDIIKIRKRLSLTQQRLADFMNVSKKTVEYWERKKKPITGPVVTLLKILEENPALMEYYTIPERCFPLRLWYMYHDEICSVIDVDEKNRRIKLYNFTDSYLKRAFGRNSEPNYQDYEEFIESRCFPKDRDKMKLILDDLGIPFYEPMLIIEKTEGKMAEDDFWIRIER